jgi:DNA-directed RNA polymerase subunit F
LPRKITEETEITISEVKEELEKNKETLDEFQQRTYDYVKKFTRLKPKKSIELIKKLQEQFEIERTDAVQIANCMPSSIEELRGFFVGSKKKIIVTSQLEAVLKLLDSFR